MREMGLVVLFLFVMFPVAAQDIDELHLYPYQEDDFRPIITDTAFLYSSAGVIPVFDAVSRYSFNFVTYDRRGLSAAEQRHWLGDLDMNSGGKYPDFTLFTVLREATVSRLSYDNAGRFLPEIYYEPTPFVQKWGHSAAAGYSDRRYRASLRFSSAGGFGEDWYYAVRLNRKWGRDAFIRGVFTDAATISLNVGKQFKNNSNISIIALLAPTQRSSRAWTTMEAIELTGDKYYNPSWGMFEGKERSSRVNMDFTPLLAAVYEMGAGGRTVYRFTVGWRFGERRRSGLTWYDARNPAPDYYMNLPSYFADPELSEAVGQAWRTQDSYRHLDWQALYEANLFSGGDIRYVLADRVERLGDFQGVFKASTVFDRRLKAEWGARVRYDQRRYFKRAGDLLGGDPFPDVYQYMIDDQYYSEKRVNDIRNPRRLVGAGDIFGYDYDMVAPSAIAFGNITYSGGRLHLGLAAELSFGSMWRSGRYENALFTGDMSFGRSERLRSTTYDLGVNAIYHFTQNNRVGIRCSVAEHSPAPDNIFLAPEYHNFVSAPGNSLVWGGEVKYSGFFGAMLGVELSAYLVRESGATDILRYYDDLYADYAADNLSGYSIMTMRNLDRNVSGFEAAASVDITPRLVFRAAGAINRYIYAADPDIEIVADANLTSRLTGGKAGLKGYVTGSSPQSILSVSARYSTRSRWNFEVNWMYAGHRYVDVSPVRRTDRILALASSPEERTAFMEQERLPDATSLNVYVSKGFRLAGCDFFASMSVNNLLGNDVVYGGYEQHRISKSGTGINRTYRPFPSKYAYSYPRSVYATLIVSF